jgi:PUA domain protein
MKVLNNKEIKELLGSIPNFDFSKKDKFETENDVIFVNHKPMFFYHENRIAPTLKLLLQNNFLKKITVDMGAVRFVANGADIMRPGIKNIESGITKDEIISIVDENHSKPLAVGIALFPREEMQLMTSGKVIKNIHWVGDKIWSLNTLS